MNIKNKIQISLGVCVFSALLLKVSLPAQNNSGQEIERFWIKKTHKNNSKNIIVCGDSRIYRGVSTEKLIASSGRKFTGINFGYSSAGYSEKYLDLALSKFDKDGEHKILILGITPHSLTKEACINEQLTGFLKMSNFEVNKKLYLYPVTEFFPARKPSEIKVTKNNYVQKFNADGWVASYKINANPEEALTSYKKTFSKYKVNSEVVNRFLVKIKEISSKKGITVIAFRPPTSVKMRRLEDEISGFDELYIRKQLKDMGVRWVTFNNSDYESYDGSHLHYKSAEKLSRQLGIILNIVLEQKEKP